MGVLGEGCRRGKVKSGLSHNRAQTPGLGQGLEETWRGCALGFAVSQTWPPGAPAPQELTATLTQASLAD